mmetsp:Transcript_10901/g.19691  ORF Transcript_10901/g.19691 Transcript_10901/m.19691 type:complete len:449 (-) Transcript_10901:258-1604(-)|eukprot:CAMPEP_0182451888 /NCGR_PEP_ID=MMETSP1172-20130603/43962_1 /TAXON_ID=708627 /ORGANISM="Timspurckia oligopyrenoides, Strain CCMP3278" /LENGTH=448 /DNA_ID=CAMNT_0024649695 /DNA_START=1097 /DNA_END=2443 /DNA_ORIENTATION=+
MHTPPQPKPPISTAFQCILTPQIKTPRSVNANHRSPHVQPLSIHKRIRIYSSPILLSSTKNSSSSSSSPSSSSAPKQNPEPTKVSGAELQQDDGSLQLGATFVPKPLFRRDQPRVSSSLRELLILCALFLTWYYTNTVFNLYNKQVLKTFPYPITCTALQFLVASLLMMLLWVFKLQKPPQLDTNQVTKAVAPLALLHALGFLLTNMSLGSVSVAFTHTVKATEPFFSVALSPSILGVVPTWGVVGSLFPIVAGVALASATDVSFTWLGFLSAMGSNLALQSRNVLSKKVLNSNSARSELSNVNLFAVMSMFAFVMMAPVALAVEGWKLSGSAVAASGFAATELWKLLAMGGLCRCGDVLASYMILNRVSPVTHSVGNCVKRAVVISMSVIVFQTPMSVLNIAGTVLALLGVLMYSLIVVGCKQNKFGTESVMCKPVYELELADGAGI